MLWVDDTTTHGDGGSVYLKAGPAGEPIDEHCAHQLVEGVKVLTLLVLDWAERPRPWIVMSKTDLTMK